MNHIHFKVIASVGIHTFICKHKSVFLRRYKYILSHTTYVCPRWFFRTSYRFESSKMLTNFTHEDDITHWLSCNNVIFDGIAVLCPLQSVAHLLHLRVCSVLRCKAVVHPHAWVDSVLVPLIISFHLITCIGAYTVIYTSQFTLHIFPLRDKILHAIGHQSHNKHLTFLLFKK